jgi:uncharacterized protein (TIGR00297 family)
VIDLLSLPTVDEWWRLAIVVPGVLMMILAGEGARVLLRLSPEFTRKFVHISVGLLIFFAPWIFTSAVPALILAVLFIVQNAVAVHLGLFKSMHGTSRKTFGTVYYPLAFFLLIVLFWRDAPMILSLSMLVLALADAAAAIVGETVRHPAVFALSSDKKSVQGSIAYFCTAVLVLTPGLLLYPSDTEYSLPFAALVAVVAATVGAGWEALSSRGLDNLSVPLSTALVLACYLMPSLGIDAQLFTIGAVLALLIAFGSQRAGFLAPSGAVATFLLAVVVFGLGGWKWTVPILAFFILSSVLSKIGKAHAGDVSDLHEKGSTRDYAQVFANGGVPGLLVLAAAVAPTLDAYPLYLGSVAAVTADTWGTEIGLMGKGRTVLITTFRPVRPGINGGVSALGLLGGTIGASLIGASSLGWIGSTTTLWTVVLAGLVGSLVDSYAGATLQAQYRCLVCSKMTERSRHCGTPAPQVCGIRWISNDTVNWMCAGGGAVAAAALSW